MLFFGGGGGGGGGGNRVKYSGVTLKKLQRNVLIECHKWFCLGLSVSFNFNNQGIAH
jgi:hypothetical protein